MDRDILRENVSKKCLVRLNAGNDGIRLQPRITGNPEPYSCIRIRQVKFPSTIETDPVGPVFDGEYSTQMRVPSPEEKLKDPEQRVHRS